MNLYKLGGWITAAILSGGGRAVKYKLASVAIAVIVIITVIFSVRCYLIRNTIETSPKNHLQYYSVDILGRNIFGSFVKGNLFGISVIKIGEQPLYEPEIITNTHSLWIVFFYRKKVMIYSPLKKKDYDFSLQNGVIKSGCISIIDKTKMNRLLLIIGNKSEKYGNKLIVSNIFENNKNISFSICCEKKLGEMRPWKIQTADVDGDGMNEISIAMYKKTPFQPFLANRPFLYSWIGTDIAPKWLGSRLAMPFEDYIFEDINGDKKDELVSIERTKEGKRVIRAYCWKGFGFEAIGDSSEYDRITQLQKGQNSAGMENKITAIITSEGKTKKLYFTFKGNRFVN